MPSGLNLMAFFLAINIAIFTDLRLLQDSFFLYQPKFVNILLLQT